MLGVTVNAVAVIIGSAIGLLCKKGIPDKYTDAIMKGLALCVLYIGISGSLSGENTIVVIISIVLGAAIGTFLDIDGHLTRIGNALEQKVNSKGKKTTASGNSKTEEGSIAKGFVTASLLFCIGAMTIVGSLTAGLSGDNEMLFTKSLLDFISAIMLTVSLGIGVMFSSIFVFVFQGAIAMLAGFLAPILSTAAINEIVCAGSLLIIGIGLNMIGLTKLKLADYMPSLILVPIILKISELL